MKIQNTGTAEYIVVQKLASYFKVSKDELYKEVQRLQKDRGDSLVYSEMLGEKAGMFGYYRCLQVDHLVIENLLFFDKFVKSKIYEDFTHHETERSYRLMLVLKGAVWVLYRGLAYDGPGAICLRDTENRESFIIEPIQNYLKHNFPPIEQ